MVSKLKMLLRKLLPDQVKIRIRAMQIFLIKKFQTVSQKPIGFLLLTPRHGNLGDHALAYSELAIFKDIGLKIVEITGHELRILLHFPQLLKNLFKKGNIFFNGGGSLGTLWFEDETMLRQVIELFTNKAIIIFPQTIYYDDSEFGRLELEKAVEIYGKDKKLIIMAREKSSYDFLRSNFSNEIYLMPDMVLYLKPKVQAPSRAGAITLFRNDCEKTIPLDQQNEIIEFLNKKFETVEISDMNWEENILLPKNREAALNKKFLQIASKRLVVTDRLHGMVFSAITGTPCIVFNSLSPKVKGIYDWFFKDCEYITFMQDVDYKKIDLFIHKVCNLDYEYDRSYLIPYYNKFKEIINGANKVGQ